MQSDFLHMDNYKRFNVCKPSLADEDYPTLSSWVSDMFMRCYEALLDGSKFNRTTFLFRKEKHHLLTEQLQYVGKKVYRHSTGDLTEVVNAVLVMNNYRTIFMPALDETEWNMIKKIVSDYNGPYYKSEDGRMACFLALIYLYYSKKNGLQVVEYSTTGNHSQRNLIFRMPFTLAWSSCCTARINFNFPLPDGYDNLPLDTKVPFKVLTTDMRQHREITGDPRCSLTDIFNELEDDAHYNRAIDIDSNGNYSVYYYKEREGFDVPDCHSYIG